MKPRSSFPVSRLGGLALGLGMLAAPFADAAPGALQERALANKAQARRLVVDAPLERLVVKFHEGTRVRLRGGRMVALTQERGQDERALLSRQGLTDARLESDVASVLALVERAPRIGGVARLFKEDESLLAERKRTGEERGGRQLADLDLYFEVPLLPGTRAEDVTALVERLNALDSVEVAYAEPRPEPAMVDFGMSAAVRSLLAAADLPPTTPLYEGNQGYLNAAPSGIDARYAWTVAGGAGAGVRIVDVEGGWRTTHEDMPALFFQGGTQVNDIGWRNHGTAVLGEMVGVANGYGVTGIAHQAQAGVQSYAVGTASAISSAATAAGSGGVVLIELHSQGPSDGTACTCNTGQCNYIAMEYWQANYDAIATATANGVTVVEAAGNGSANLDAAAYGNAFNRTVRDSGAIVVGASTATTRVPMCWTNYGSRVDVHGWGEQVVSMGYGDLFASGEDQYYTASFSGTSSASPIVTGAAASLQGVARASGRGALSPLTVRQILAETGTPQAASSQNIGRLPDLRQAITRVLNSGSSVCKGSTPQGATNWQVYSPDDLYLDVNTAGCGFTSTPLYFTSLGGASSHWTSSGATAIYTPTATGFRVYVRSPGITPAQANAWGWYLNWQATPNNLHQPSLCTGQTAQGATNWQVYTADDVYLDVNTAACGFASTPLYFTSLGGTSSHWVALGATAIYIPTATGFRVYVRSPGITPALANQLGWHLNWQATPNNLNQPSLCTGQTTQGATNWQVYSPNDVFLDVNTAGCGFASTPQYVTSLGGTSSHWVASGATAIYTPTATGFRVYVQQSGITPALANQLGWHLNWSAR
ncbi:S8 family peptidase [Pyxidicoccus sp. MSG2]|uniref:S8 family peptidase n=1 Tax=Pyxidicoccus sp. MSG2 TaxID=2996790 RepID=UPI00226EBD3C|nr:S8 family peptidase [Pyxidicoccus sp. MSG2]MCY1014192.1 S8 family serine peptidase [Pyxidicoccus sp. MSG2]